MGHVSFLTWGAFALVCVGLVLTPGPNMLHLVSRALCQGRAAALVALAGVATGFFVYLLLAAFGITALLLAVPFAYVALKACGAAYLAWLAWGAFRSKGEGLATKRLAAADVGRLYSMGLVTNLLNPKIAMLYLALLPQFIDAGAGHVFGQTMQLGLTQIAIGVGGDAAFIMVAGALASFLARRPAWARAQRWLMGGVLGGLALRLALDEARP